MINYCIAPLHKQHDKKNFQCGVPLLDDYLKQQASQDKRRHVTAIYVLTEMDSHVTAGYYTLSSTSICLTSLPEEITHKLPRYPTLPATLLGRLAIDQTYQGKNLGELLLADALRRSLEISDKIASSAVVVESKNHHSTRFYLKYGFIPFSDYENHLFLPMATIKNVWGTKA